MFEAERVTRRELMSTGRSTEEQCDSLPRSFITAEHDVLQFRQVSAAHAQSAYLPTPAPIIKTLKSAPGAGGAAL